MTFRFQRMDANKDGNVDASQLRTRIHGATSGPRATVS